MTVTKETKFQSSLKRIIFIITSTTMICGAATGISTLVWSAFATPTIDRQIVGKLDPCRISLEKKIDEVDQRNHQEIMDMQVKINETYKITSDNEKSLARIEGYLYKLQRR